MIEHLVLFRFRDDVVQEDRDHMLDLLKAFPDHFTAMQDFRIGDNRSERDDTFTHAFTVRFDDWESLHRYLASDAHNRFVDEEFRPRIGQRAIVSFEPTLG